MRQIEFTHTGHSHALGNFSAGDTARVPDELAAHMVNEAGCAKYIDVQVSQPVQTPAQDQTATKGAKKGKQ